MANQNTGVEREQIGTRIDEDITGLESREERDRVGSFGDTDRAPSRPRVTASKAAPVPTMPPPTMRMSSSLPGSIVALSAASDASRAAGPSAPWAKDEPPEELFISRLHPHQTS